MNAVELECATCVGPVKGGITLGFSIGALAASTNGPFTGATLRISIPLTQSSGGKEGWKKDSQNALLPWAAASQCDIIQVLSRLSRIRILGDWTTWQESVALDDVRIVNTKGEHFHALLDIY